MRVTELWKSQVSKFKTAPCFSSALQCGTCSVVGLLYPAISLSAVTLKGTVTTQSPSHLT